MNYETPCHYSPPIWYPSFQVWRLARLLATLGDATTTPPSLIKFINGDGNKTGLFRRRVSSGPIRHHLALSPTSAGCPFGWRAAALRLAYFRNGTLSSDRSNDAWLIKDRRSAQSTTLDDIGTTKGREGRGRGGRAGSLRIRNIKIQENPF